MASNKSTEDRIRERAARIKELTAALLAAEAEEDGDAWEHETIDDIENAMLRIGDAVAREVGVQKLARHTQQAKDERCPNCGHVGDHVGERRREIITSRGKTEVTEAKYHCPKCRQDFFPSDRTIGN